MDQLIVWGKLNRRYHFSRPARWGLGGYNLPQRPGAQADQLDVISRRLETMARSTHKALDVRFCVTWYLRWKLLEARLTPSQPSSITFGHGKLWAGVEQAALIVSRVLTLPRGTFWPEGSYCGSTKHLVESARCCACVCWWQDTTITKTTTTNFTTFYHLPPPGSRTCVLPSHYQALRNPPAPTASTLSSWTK